MRAVNLIPTESRRGGGGPSRTSFTPVHAVLGLLGVAVLFVTVYVLSNNTISERKSKLANLQAEVAQANAQAAQLANFAQFAVLARSRAETVREIAASRFDWQSALSNLSQVVPANTSLQSLIGTAATGASTGATSGGSGASTGALRAAIAAPAFEIRGCSKTQDQVAQLMSRLRLINGVTRVTLSDSQKSATAQVGASVSSRGLQTGCKANTPSFDLVVFFTGLPSAGPSGVASVSTVAAAGAAGATASTPAGTTTTPAATTAAATTPSPATTPPASQPVSTTTASGG